ncbi:tRNA 2-thiouridine(34) synthase MnmA [Bacteroidota bacterium]
MRNKNVLVAMSGGIDSSIAAILLQEEGYIIKGLTFQTWGDKSVTNMDDEKFDKNMQFIFEARELAKKLGFEHHVMDLRNIFKESVINYFIDEYISGRTPNPCVYCNAHIKWGVVMKKTDELGCDFMASGHYTRIRENNGRFILSKGKDSTKDQSYFLWNISQEKLKRIIFPLGNYDKTEIRKMAKERGFKKLSEKSESQEICFIQDEDYRSFLKKNVPDIDNKIVEGDFISTNGKYLGKHKGYPYYTIGQRKGLVIAVGHPLYVVKIDAENNIVTLGNKEDLNTSEMTVRDINYVKYSSIPENIELSVKIRYRNIATSCEISEEKPGNILKIKFHSPVSGVTPGQSAVFYEKDDIVAGGIIC